MLVEDVSALGRFDDPEAVLAAECRIVGEVASELKRLGYAHLGRLLAVTPTRGQPLLAVAVQYYFRRAVGADEVLARELTWNRLGTLDHHLEDGFAFLALIQERQSQALEERRWKGSLGSREWPSRRATRCSTSMPTCSC